jgi:ADP-heptose:LPS heptosyltransferase
MRTARRRFAAGTEACAKPAEPRIGVFVPGDGIGDAMMRIPLLHAMRERWPAHTVWWVTKGATAMSGALREYAAPYLERIHTGFDGESRASVMFREAAQLPRFDVVFNFYTRIASVLLLKCILAPRLHYSTLALQLGSSHRDPQWLVTRPKHMFDRIRSIAVAAGCELPPARSVFEVGPAARRAAAGLIPAGGRAIAFAVASGNTSIQKNWPVERFLAVAEQRRAAGDVPVFLIGPAERPFADRIRSALPNAILAQLDRPDPETGAAGIELTLAVAERLTAAVLNDSGLAHVLAVAGLPQLVLFGPTDPARWAPDGGLLRVLRARDFGSDAMEAIPTRAVEAELASLLAQVPGPHPARAALADWERLAGALGT